VRSAPGPRHELICARLHQAIQAALRSLTSTRVLVPRSPVQVALDALLCPDLALVTAATGKLWLAAEIISSDDHAPDTVAKKQIYEEIKLPRLWMIDPRYDNVEIYHATQYGLVLQGILAGRQHLSEKLLPALRLTIADLFSDGDECK
jgi:Uma2 family endonuclease